MKVVLMGGTGQTGRPLVEALRGRGHEALPASPSTGVNAVTGEGLADALAGARVVVDVTNAPSPEEVAATDFFRISSENLAVAEKEAGVRHHVLLSIVGLEPAGDLAYYRAKLAQEAAVRAGGMPHTIVRATQFFEFLGLILQVNTVGDELRLAPLSMQPIALADVVEFLVEIVESEPADGNVEVAGPEVLALDEIGRRLAAPGQRVTSGGKPFFGADIPDGALVAGPSARLGRTTLEQWSK